MLRFLTAGESHGQALVVIVEGLPAGLPITVEDIQAEMARRRLGYGRGPRQKFEQDELTLARRRASRPHARLAGRDRDQELASGSAATSGTRRCRRRPARPRSR